jgi:putative transcriptional regulator
MRAPSARRTVALSEIAITNDIRRLRLQHNEMTQRMLADRIGVTCQMVNAIELGKYSLSLEVAFRIAAVFRGRWTRSSRLLRLRRISMAARQDGIDTRLPGMALLTSSFIALAAMAQHPTIGDIRSDSFAKNVERVASLTQMVHGTMIVLVAIITWTLIVFALRRGISRWLMLQGVVAWVIGAASMIVAAAFNGFVVIDIARTTTRVPEATDMLKVVLQGFGAGVGVIEVIGAVAISSALILWSADLTRNNSIARWVGVFGLVAAAGLIIALATGMMRLNVPGMMLVVAVWAVWFLAVGALMTLRKV